MSNTYRVHLYVTHACMCVCVYVLQYQSLSLSDITDSGLVIICTFFLFVLLCGLLTPPPSPPLPALVIPALRAEDRAELVMLSSRRQDEEGVTDGLFRAVPLVFLTVLSID